MIFKDSKLCTMDQFNLIEQLCKGNNLKILPKFTGLNQLELAAALIQPYFLKTLSIDSREVVKIVLRNTIICSLLLWCSIVCIWIYHSLLTLTYWGTFWLVLGFFFLFVFCFFFFWPCLPHVKLPRARNGTCASAVTKATAVTTPESSTCWARLFPVLIIINKADINTCV